MDALALLRLQMEWGADEALSEAPVDRLRPAASIQSPGPRGPHEVPARQPGASPDGAPPPRGPAAERAAAAASEAGSLEALQAAIAAFDGCALRQTASHLVFAEGDASGGLLLIGEPPGAEEDRAGRPFAGPEGALLDKMLASIGLDRRGLLLAPLIPWRPPGGRSPNTGELAACLPFLHRLIALAAPRFLVVFGTLPARTLLPGRRRASGWATLTTPRGDLPSLTLPGFGALLRTPPQRREVWAALRLLRRALNGEPIVTR